MLPFELVTNNEDSTTDEESCTSASTLKLLADVGVHESGARIWKQRSRKSLVGAGQEEDEVDDDNVQREIESLVDQKFDLADQLDDLRDFVEAKQVDLEEMEEEFSTRHSTINQQLFSTSTFILALRTTLETT